MDTAIHTATRQVRDALDGRRLIWFGIRGEDGEALLQLPELDASFSITAPVRSGRIDPDANVSLEEISGVRPDLDRYDIDLDPGAHTTEFRARLLRELSGRCVLMTYRPSSLISALAFSMADTMTLAGLFKDRQSAFEHKPWVERSLAARGIAGLGWRYVADEHRSRVTRLLDGGPQILRASRASGGVGIALVRSEDEVDRSWPSQADAFVAVAPFLEQGVPLNFSGCVFDDGSVRMHPPSVQLIGIASCTQRAFGYCGNDFAATRGLEGDVLDQLDAMGTTVGHWLHEERYRGAFGVDALLHQGEIRFVEINARFQGSSAISAEIARELEMPDLFVDHLAAALGLAPATPGLTIAQWAGQQAAQTQIVLHNISDRPVVRDRARPLPPRPAGAQLAQLARDGVRHDPGAALLRLTVPGSATTTGFELDPGTEAVVASLRECFIAVSPDAERP